MLARASMNRPMGFVSAAAILIWACQVSVKSPESPAERTSSTIQNNYAEQNSTPTSPSKLGGSIKSWYDAYLLRDFLAGDFDEISKRQLSLSDQASAEKKRKIILAKIRAAGDGRNVANELSVQLQCVKRVDTVLTKYATGDIRPDEDDTQFRKRQELIQDQLNTFRRVFAPAPDLSRDELRNGYAFAFGPSLYSFPDELYRSSERDHWIKVREDINKELKSKDAFRGPCSERFVLIVYQWLPRYDELIAAQRKASQVQLDAKAEHAQDSERNAVLWRRFAPIRSECETQWVSQNEKCARLPGLSDAEKQKCQEICAEAGDRSYQRQLELALTKCIDIASDNPSPPIACVVTKPAGAGVDDTRFKHDLAACSKDCKARADTLRAEATAGNKLLRLAEVTQRNYRVCMSQAGQSMSRAVANESGLRDDFFSKAQVRCRKTANCDFVEKNGGGSCSSDYDPR